MEKPALKALRHGVALGIALLSMFVGRAILAWQLLPYLVRIVPRGWLPYATIQSEEGFALMLFEILWPFLVLLPTAVLAEARIFHKPPPSDLVRGALAISLVQASLTAVVSFALWPWPLDNLLRILNVAVASIAYWIALRGLAAFSRRWRLNSSPS